MSDLIISKNNTESEGNPRRSMDATSPTSSIEAEQILLEEKGRLRIISLNRPKKLNALSFSMISRLLDHFLSYEKDLNVNLIVLKGNGKSFCAGGDAAAIARNLQQGNWRSCAHYYRKMFNLNYVLATYIKPQVSILDGIVMGGGAGISIHGRFRVATENSVFAMPETALGLFPDVGASYFLSRLPGFIGEYLGLTGSRLDGAEMLACGIATHYIKSERLSSLIEVLQKVCSRDPSTITAILDEHSEVPHLKVKSVCHKLIVINKCFSRKTVEGIFSALVDEFCYNKNDCIALTIQILKKASPTSLKISLRSIREGRVEEIGKCLVREYRMVCNVMRGEINKDFVEGCRAMLLDKDKNPKWEPSRLELVNDAMVDLYFLKIEERDCEDLELLPRSNLPRYANAKL